MSNSLRSFRIFSSEIMKAAAKINDADIRALLSERKGEEYLQGGKLLSNSGAEAQYVEKLSSSYSGAGLLASDAYDLKAKKKKDNNYQKARDYAYAGTKGGLTALGLLGAANAMRGRFGAPSGAQEIRKAMKSARKAFGVGSSIAVADRAYRHDDFRNKGHNPDHKEKIALVAPNPASAFRSAATALSKSQRTGGFKSSVVHRSGKPPRVIQLGQKFRVE